jgi:hypothetical protein
MGNIGGFALIRGFEVKKGGTWGIDFKGANIPGPSHIRV